MTLKQIVETHLSDIVENIANKKDYDIKQAEKDIKFLLMIVKGCANV